MSKTLRYIIIAAAFVVVNVLMWITGINSIKVILTIAVALYLGYEAYLRIFAYVGYPFKKITEAIYLLGVLAVLLTVIWIDASKAILPKLIITLVSFKFAADRAVDIYKEP